jgi:CopG family transcriptional regulator, nickel-responsive regulator
MNTTSRGGVSRISISLPETLLQQLDGMVREKNYESRSQAIAEMINHQLIEHRRQYGDTVMTGTITLVYNNTTPGLQRQLANLQYEYIDEVISSLHVNLMHAQTMEVILVQGPGQRLQLIADKMSTARGVISGKLQVTSALIPPIHPFRTINERDEAVAGAPYAASGQTV